MSQGKTQSEILDQIKPSYIKELAAVRIPTPLVNLVMSAVFTIIEKEPAWPNISKELKDRHFIEQLYKIENEKICEDTAKKLK